MAKFKIFGRDVAIGKDLNQYSGRADDMMAVYQQKYGYDYRSRNKLRAYRNVVYGCVSLIGSACGDYQPILQQKVGDQWKAIDHEFLQLLRQPSGRDLKSTSFSGYDLWEATASYGELQGDCYWYLARGKTTGKPREIVVLRADRVGTDINPDTGDVDGYFLRNAGGAVAMPLEVDEVLRFPSFNPTDPYKGYGGVEAGADYIETDEATAAFTKNFFGNNAGLSGVLNIKGEVTKGAFRKFVRAWRDKYQGVDNAGKVAILRDSDASFTKVGLGLDELDMESLRKMSLQDVAMIFKVPLELLGRVTEGSGLGRGNIETLEYIFAKWNIDKKMTKYDSVIMFALQRYYNLDPSKYRVVHANIIPEDKEHELAERTAAVDKWATRNEIRDEDGLDHIKGGDQLYIPIQQIPLDESSTADASSTASAGLRVKIIRTVTGKKKDLEAADIVELQPTCKCQSEPSADNKCVTCGLPYVEKSVTRANPNRKDAERFRLSLMRNQSLYERRYKTKMKPILAAQQKEVLASLEAHASSFSTATKDFSLFSDSDYDQQMVKSLTPILTDLTDVQGALALVFSGDTDNSFLLTAPMREILRRGTLEMAQNFNDRTLERLNATLAAGVTAGEGIGDLKQRVNSVYEQLNGYESTRIARTETLKSSNAASGWAYKQNGDVSGKEWVVNPDACAECESFDGKTVPLDDAFLAKGDSYDYTDEDGQEQTKVNTYDTVEVPPLHPNCRCTIIPVR